MRILIAPPLLLLLCSILSAKSLKAQEGYVKYRQVLNLDTTRFFKDTTGITAYLFFQPDRSLYVYNRSKDAETYSSLRERMEQGASELSYGQSDKQGNMIYKDFSGQQLWIRKLVWGKAFRTTEPLPLQHWELLPDTTVLMNYRCRKAITRFRGRDYEAWYCPDLPVRDGPWKFHGLPGLILEVADTQRKILMTAFSIQIPASTGADLQKPVSGPLISLEAFKHIEQTETDKLVRFLMTTSERGHGDLEIQYNFYPLEIDYHP